MRSISPTVFTCILSAKHTNKVYDHGSSDTCGRRQEQTDHLEDQDRLTHRTEQGLYERGYRTAGEDYMYEKENR